MTRRVRLSIEGMHCDHCETTVGAALERAGLTDVAVDWRRGTAVGAATEAYTPDTAREAVAETGYQLTRLEEDEDDTGALAHPQDQSEPDYDLLIIGSGAAAFAAAIKARELDARVGIVERATVGGTCVNIGCVPSKALLRAAEHYWRAGHSPFAGVPTSVGPVDLGALVAQKRDLVDQLRQGKYIDLLDVYGIDLLAGDARFADAARVEVGDRVVTARRILVATGAEPWVPPIPGLDEIDYLTSTSALELEDVPERLIVIGANAIGLELGQLFLHLGSQVTFVEALDRIAPFEEPEISAALADYLRGQGAEVLTGAQATGAGRTEQGVWLEVASNGGTQRREASRLLMATGRRARTAGLGLDRAGVETDARGHIVVDETLQTSNPSIYAAGDVTDHPQFVYVAALGGNLAAENALRDAGRRIDFRTMPRVTFTAPTVASVGLTEEAARAAGTAVITSVLPLEAVPRALVDHATDGVIKLVADEATGQLLGAHVLADGAGDVIQAAVMAIRYRATVDELADTFHPYLTMAEGLKLAAQAFGKDVKHLSCCAA